ncbi:MAG: TonB-dependent receptor [Acidimicrobiia bacterium]|nr:TonB-dependent receptor [Acidimicrobiia bacterium]
MNSRITNREGQIKVVRLLAVVLFLAAFSAAPVAAQVSTATLTGLVRDPSGAVMPNVKVTVTNVETNISREVQTNETGTYRIAALNPGNYTVEAELAGFKKAVLPGIVLQVNQQGRIDITLEVGEVTETITVEGAAPIIDTESPMIGGVVDETKVIGLPLNGRNFMELTTLTGGINEGGNYTSKNFLNKGFAPAAAGAPATENNYQLDGADNKEEFFHSYNVAPSVDAVQEFRIQIGQYSAEFGAGGGAVINVVTKSGTNEFHGAAWEFIRNDVFDARNFFLPATTKKAPLRRNQFGVAGGGPIFKDRTFVFGNYDGTRIRQGVFRSAVVPTAAERAGDFSGFSRVIRDPQTGRPFPGNIIPANRIDKISAGLVKYYPLPNNPSNPRQNFIANASLVDDLDSFLVRFDHRVSDKHNFMARYAVQDIFRSSPSPQGYPLVGGQLTPQRFQNLVGGLTSTLSPNVLNEFRMSYGRTVHRLRGQNTGNPIAADLGIPYALRDNFNSGMTNISLNGTTFSGLGEGTPWYLTVNSFQWYDGVTWTRGKHNIKFGGDFRRNVAPVNFATRLNNSYIFNGQFSGDAFADFLLGLQAESWLALKANDPAKFTRHQLAYYVLDDWKVSPKLTLNVGLRYEYAQVPVEASGFTPTFNPRLGNGVGGLMYPKQNTTAKAFFEQVRPDLPFGFLDRRSMFTSDKNNYAPRFGFAYRPFSTDRTVVRGGYGIFFSNSQLMNLVQNSTTAPPGQLWPTIVSDTRTPTVNWGGVIGVEPINALRSLALGMLTGFENNWKDGLTQQWSLSIGQELSHNFVVEAQYLGSKSDNLETLIDYNTAPPAPGALVSRVPFPKWGRLSGFSSGAAANYNAVLLSAERRFANDLSFKGAYTFGKALGFKNGRISGGNVSFPQDPNNLGLENGHSSDDISNRFTFNYIWQLPFGTGKRFGNAWGGAANKIIGGWSFSGIVTFRDGFYLTPGIPRNNCNHSVNNSCRADVVSGFFLGGNGVNSPRWDRSKFDWPTRTGAAPRYGNAGVNILKGNGINNWDLAVLKDTQITERFRAQFRAEFFNAWNHASFANPIADPTNPNFGRTFSTILDPRDIQFGLKFYW